VTRRINVRRGVEGKELREKSHETAGTKSKIVSDLSKPSHTALAWGGGA